MQDLIRELKSELRGHFEDVVIALMMKPTEYECHELRESVKVLLLDGISRGSMCYFEATSSLEGNHGFCQELR